MQRHSYNIHERFLRHIWSKQYLKAKIKTSDGRLLTVLDVGESNLDGGPDFRNAKIKLDGITYIGDIEIHRTTFDWFRHQHQEDPRYNQVILHVVLEASSKVPQILVQSGRQVPVLILGNFLSDSIQTIWQKAILDERAKKSETINCYQKNKGIDIELLDRWLTKLSIERLELKLHRFEERLKQLADERRMALYEKYHSYGEPPLEGEHNEIPPPIRELTQKDFSKRGLWEQVLYEGVMEALGYSKNQKPFLRLARSLTLKEIVNHQLRFDNLRLEAMLFGVSGLIPKINTLKEKESRVYVRRLTREWKALRPFFHSELLNAADWQYFPTRPSNFPTSRLAAACALIRKFYFDDLFRNIVQMFKSDHSPIAKQQELLRVFSIELHYFWKYHYGFDNKTIKPVTALGTQRIHEIIINAVLPIVLLYARIFKEKQVREGALSVYSTLSPSENNSIIQMMENQLLKGRLALKNVSQQQAIIQLYKYYCSEKRCSECMVNIKATN